MNGLTILMFDPKDRRKLRALREDGYLKRDNPLAPNVLATLLTASVTRPQWYEAFLDMDASGDGTKSEILNNYVPEEDMTTTPLFQMLGRSDPQATDATKRILACWLRHGLGARVKDIAAEMDVDSSAASRVRTKWEWEIRALLQDARCLGLTGEDLYYAVSTPHYEPTRLLQRLGELRAARSDVGAPGLLAAQYEQELRDAWFRRQARMTIHIWLNGRCICGL
jgi:hypothetical protein